MIRAGVDDIADGARGRHPVSKLFTLVFCLGAGLAGGRRHRRADHVGLPGPRPDMLPLALIVVILGASAASPALSPAASSPGFVYTSAWRSFPQLAYGFFSAMIS